MKITKLTVSNVMRVKAVEIVPDGNVVVISGNNAQGKTSIFRAIEMAFAGTRVAPPRPIRDGADEGYVIAETEEFTVERRWTRETENMLAGNVLEVRSKAGAKIPSPQAMLDKLKSKLSFNPLAFMQLEPREKLAQLQQLVGLDFKAHDSKRLALFNERTSVNRDVKALEARMPAAVNDVPLPVDAKALMAELAKMDADLRFVEKVASDVAMAEQRVKDAEAGLAAARKLLNDAQNVVMPEVDPMEVAAKKKQLVDASATNALVQKAAERKRLEGELALLTDKAESMTEELAELDKAKANAIAGAKFPVPGLGLGAEGVLLNDLPVEQASAAEQLRLSVATGLALNPKLRVMLVPDASLLDDASLGIVKQMAADNDSQLWIEIVSSGGVGIVIEDGMVKGDHETQGPGPEEAAAGGGN